MNILYETPNYLLLQEQESGILKEKSNNKILWEISIYGNPTCAWMDAKEQFAIFGGHHIAIWMEGKETSIEQSDLQDVYAIRIYKENWIELLIDPWADYSAIWRMNINTLVLEKVCPFPDYQNQPYTEHVVW